MHAGSYDLEKQARKFPNPWHNHPKQFKSHCPKHIPAISEHHAECRSATGSENCTQERVVARAQITALRGHNTIRHPGPQRAQKTAPRSLLEPVARAQRTVAQTPQGHASNTTGPTNNKSCGWQIMGTACGYIHDMLGMATQRSSR